MEQPAIVMVNATASKLNYSCTFILVYSIVSEESVGCFMHSGSNRWTCLLWAVGLFATYSLDLHARNRLAAWTGYCVHLWIHWKSSLSSRSYSGTSVIYHNFCMEIPVQNLNRSSHQTCHAQPATSFFFTPSTTLSKSGPYTNDDWTAQFCLSSTFSFFAGSDSTELLSRKWGRILFFCRADYPWQMTPNYWPR